MAWHSTERPSCLLAQTSPLLSITHRCGGTECAAALANTALEFSLTLGVKSGLFKTDTHTATSGQTLRSSSVGTLGGALVGTMCAATVQPIVTVTDRLQQVL